MGSGGKGGGKTAALARRAILLGISSPYFGDLSGNYGVLGRLRLKDFYDTTYKEFMHWLPRSWIRKFYKKDGILELVNESVYQFTHLDSIEHLVGLSIGFAGIDQIEQIPESVFDELAYNRVRLKVLNRFRYVQGKKIQIIPHFNADGDCISIEPDELSAVLKYQNIFGVCNPRRCWVYKRFVLNEECLESHDAIVRARHNPDYKLIGIPTPENKPYLPANYIERQRRDKNEREFKRDVLGSWDVFEGQVYSDFTDDLILSKNQIPNPSWDVYVGIDHGGTGYDNTRATGITAVTFAALEPRQGTYPKAHIFSELDLPASTIEETVVAIDGVLKATYVAQKYHYELFDKQHISPDGRIKVKAWRCSPDMMKGIQDEHESIMERYMRVASERGFLMPLAIGSKDEHERIEKTNWIFRKKLCDVNPRCINYINSHRAVEYGANEKIKLAQDDHHCESGGYLFSGLPTLWRDVKVPVEVQSIVDRELARVNSNSLYDEVAIGERAWI